MAWVCRRLSASWTSKISYYGPKSHPNVRADRTDFPVELNSQFFCTSLRVSPVISGEIDPPPRTFVEIATGELLHRALQHSVFAFTFLCVSRIGHSPEESNVRAGSERTGLTCTITDFRLHWQRLFKSTGFVLLLRNGRFSTEEILLDFPGRRLRKLQHKFDSMGRFKVREMIAGVADQFRFRCRSACF